MHAFKQIGPHYSFRPVRVQYRLGQAGGRNKRIGIPFCRTGADKSGGFPNKEGAILAKANILQRRTQQRAAFPPEFAAEIIPGRPPTKLITTAIQNEAYKPTFGSTPAMIEKAMASGIKARATTRPDNTSPRTLENHSSRKLSIKDVISKLHRARGKKSNHP